MEVAAVGGRQLEPSRRGEGKCRGLGIGEGGGKGGALAGDRSGYGNVSARANLGDYMSLQKPRIGLSVFGLS